MVTAAFRISTVLFGLSLFAMNARAERVNYFYSDAGREHVVSFRSVYRADNLTMDKIRGLSPDSQQAYTRREVLPLMDYLFGPLVHRSQGSPQRAVAVLVDWAQARELPSGQIELPYTYKGVWIVSQEASAQGHIALPVPLNRRVVYTPNWKSCSDWAPEHQTEGFFWYFWDPTRYGCDHKEGDQFATIDAQLGAMTLQTSATYPEYDRLLADGALTMTFGFGYVEDPSAFNPDADYDEGARQYQIFLRNFRDSYGSQLKESPITQGEYPSSYQKELVIGHRFTGTMNGAKVVVNIVMSAGIDQMEIFAKSFAHDHDDWFGWFGHSRVGSGFDAERFGQMVRYSPEYYSITGDQYQVIYWAGCNSYSYYTTPFFEFKGGTKNLDIIANGLPSYFSLNAINASIAASAFLNWNARASYQTIVASLEARAKQMGATVLVTVLGDEDNQ